MSSGSYHFENSHEVLKELSFALSTTEQEQLHLSETAGIDFFTFEQNGLDNVSTQHEHSTSMHNDLDPSSGVFEPCYNAPHLTPDSRGSIQYTNSSVLTGYNPDYIMSPLQISTQTASGIFQRTSTTINIEDMTGFGDDDDFFSPLLSPAIAPTHDRTHRMSTGSGGGDSSSNINSKHMIELPFSPLTSPALHSVPYQTSMSSNGACMDPNLNQISAEVLPESVLHQNLALIEKHQQLLRSAHRVLQNHRMLSSNNNSGSTATTTASPMPMTVMEAMDPTTTASQEIPRSPALAPHPEPRHGPATAAGSSSSFSSSSSTASASSSDGNFIAPATPSLLMKFGQGKSSGKKSIASTTAAGNLASSAAVDRMTSLPAPMLEDTHAISKTVSPKKHILPDTHKRRRISRGPSKALSSPGLYPSAALLSPQINVTDQSLAALLSPTALRPQMPSNSNRTISNGSASTAATTGITSSPRALKPLISPSLKPNGKRLSPLEEQVATAALAAKSNYQNMREGNARNLGIEFSSSFQSGVENRRSAHKAAEQKRRDTFKQSLESLRKEITSFLADGDGSQSGGSVKEDGTPEGEMKEKMTNQMSKVVLIQQSYEYILKLKAENRSKDNEIKKLQDELAALQKNLNDPKERT